MKMGQHTLSEPGIFQQERRDDPTLAILRLSQEKGGYPPIFF